MTGDSLRRLKEIPDESVQCCITSPPYFGLRNYGHDGQIGKESNISDYVDSLSGIFKEVIRILKQDGTLWLNLGDTYLDRGLIGVPWRVAFALKDQGWMLRQDIIWHKTDPMPEPTKDRFVRSHEHIFLFAKRGRYFLDASVVREAAVSLQKGKRKFGGVNKYKGVIQDDRHDVGNDYVDPVDGKRNRRDVWSCATANYKGAHFATYPPKLIEPAVLSATREGDIILDPFSGAGTTGFVALSYERKYLGIELNPEYNRLAYERLKAVPRGGKPL